MYIVYVLKSEIKDWVYVGMTKDLDARLIEHNLGHVNSTKSSRPFRIIYTEKCLDSIEARRREKYFKNNSGKEWLKRRGIL